MQAPCRGADLEILSERRWPEGACEQSWEGVTAPRSDQPAPEREAARPPRAGQARLPQGGDNEAHV